MICAAFPSSLVPAQGAIFESSAPLLAPSDVVMSARNPAVGDKASFTIADLRGRGHSERTIWGHGA